MVAGVASSSDASIAEMFNRFMIGLWGADRRWRDKVNTALPNAGATPGEVSRFTIVVTFKPVIGVAPGHYEFKGILAERLRRLDELIRTLEQRNMA